MRSEDFYVDSDHVLLNIDLYNKFNSLKNCIPFYKRNDEIFCLSLNSGYYNFFNHKIRLIKTEEEVFNEKFYIIKNYEKLINNNLFQDDIPIRSVLDFILMEAVSANVSDIHFNPIDNNKYVVKFKIDTVLFDRFNLNIKQALALKNRLKILNNMDISITNLPQTSSFNMFFQNDFVDFRFSTHPTFLGERFVIRILQKKNVMLIENLGLNDDVLDIVRKIIQAPYGFVVFTGPTNSGKTTLIHSILSEISKQGVCIMTLEDPVEYRVPNVIQTTVSENGLTFFDGMKSILRQDPNVIFLGEIRDRKTAEIAAQLAMLGHKVLTTLHAYSTQGALVRLIDIGVSSRILSQCLLAVFSQRLVRKFDFKKERYDGLQLVTDGVLFNDDLKRLLAENVMPNLPNKLFKIASQLVENKVTTKEEIIRIIGSEQL